MDSVVMFEGTIYEKGYGTLARAVMRDKSLHRNSKVIYAYICSFAQSSNSADRVAFPAVSLQCAELGLSEDTYYKYRKALEKKGYIKIEKKRGALGKFSKNVYKICAVVTPLEEVSPPPNSPGTGPHPNSPGPAEPRPVDSGTKSNSLKSNSLKNNKNIKNQNLDHYSLNLPMAVRKFLSLNNVGGLGSGSGSIITDSLCPYEIETFYNTFIFIKSGVTAHDPEFLNDSEFLEVVQAIVNDRSLRPVFSSRGILKDYCQRRLSFKVDEVARLAALDTEKNSPKKTKAPAVAGAPGFDWLENTGV